MRRLHSIIAILILALAIESCGLKGPLRHPDRAKPTQPAGSPSTPTQ